jgi:autotransporter family porin
MRWGSTRRTHAGSLRRAVFVVAGITLAACSSTSGGSAAPSATTVLSSGHRFETLPPGSTLPSDGECRSRIRPAHENRSGNIPFNQTVGHATQPDPPYFELAGRVTGNFTGTTDEIIQWAACKWGIDEDVVRAQVARESWWHQDSPGDFTSDASLCAPGHPIGTDGKTGQCPESLGLVQVRTQFYRPYIADAVASSAYNLDVTYAIWRSCFEGKETWLNDVEHTQPYAAGDLWGCIGRWFSGRWHTQPAEDYISSIKDYLNNQVWTTSDFAKG